MEAMEKMEKQGTFSLFHGYGSLDELIQKIVALEF
jgi:hypothetical protein